MDDQVTPPARDQVPVTGPVRTGTPSAPSADALPPTTGHAARPAIASLGEPAILVLDGPAQHGTSTETGTEPGPDQPAIPLPDLRRFVAYRLVSTVNLTGGIWILFLLDRGLSLAQVGLAEAAFHLAPVLLELPSGSLADTFGRKWSLAISSLLSALSLFLMLAVQDIWLALPAMFLAGASMTFASGAQDAFLYDAMAAGGTSDRFTSTVGQLLSASYIVLGLSTWAGASLAGLDFAVPFLLAAGFGLVGTVLALTLREPTRDLPAHRHIGRTIVEAVAIARCHPRTGSLILFAAVYWTAIALVELYAQAILSDLGLSISAVGLVIGGSYGLVAAGAWLADRATARGTFRTWMVGLSLMATLAALALGSEAVAFALSVYVVFQFSTGITEPMLANRVNERIPSAQRATVLSIQGFLYSVTMIWAFPLIGFLAERGGWPLAYGTIAAALLIALGWWVIIDRRHDLTIS
ncbi:MAG: MFS transporter [Chloroflexia bacterium]|nr:MFS transporter [Chloroflexia bacterium]